MANEITFAASVKVVKGNINETIINRSGKQWTMAASTPKKVSNVITALVASAEGDAIDLGSLTTVGVSWFKNHDTSNYVELGLRQGGTFYAFAKLPPGAEAIIPLGVAAPYVRANTANCEVEYTIYSQ